MILSQNVVIASGFDGTITFSIKDDRSVYYIFNIHEGYRGQHRMHYENGDYDDSKADYLAKLIGNAGEGGEIMKAVNKLRSQK